MPVVVLMQLHPAAAASLANLVMCTMHDTMMACAPITATAPASPHHSSGPQLVFMHASARRRCAAGLLLLLLLQHCHCNLCAPRRAAARVEQQHRHAAPMHAAAAAAWAARPQGHPLAQQLRQQGQAAQAAAARIAATAARRCAGDIAQSAPYSLLLLHRRWRRRACMRRLCSNVCWAAQLRPFQAAALAPQTHHHTQPTRDAVGLDQSALGIAWEAWAARNAALLSKLLGARACALLSGRAAPLHGGQPSHACCAVVPQ